MPNRRAYKVTQQIMIGSVEAATLGQVEAEATRWLQFLDLKTRVARGMDTALTKARGVAAAVEAEPAA